MTTASPQRRENKVTAYLDHDVFEALLRYEGLTHKSKSVIVNDALRHALMPSNREDASSTQLQGVKQALRKLDQNDEEVLKLLRVVTEALGAYIQVYFRHAPEVPRDSRDQAAGRGQERFQEFLSLVARSLRSSQSVFPIN